MQTEFSLAQLADPDTASSEKILRACVHCGFCTATCPTYVLLGDELDSPRGRIYLIKNMLEEGGPDGAKPISPETVKHIDRCLSCLGCMTTCPSGVNYMHLVDHGRRHIEAHYRRPSSERLLRRSLGRVLTRPALFRATLHSARLAKPFVGLLPKWLRPLVALAPSTVPAPSAMDRPQVFPAEGVRRRCGSRCSPAAPSRCWRPRSTRRRSASSPAMAARSSSRRAAGAAARSSTIWAKRRRRSRSPAPISTPGRSSRNSGGLDAVVANASGCGTMLKDYGFLLRTDPAYAEKAARIAALARDFSEVMSELGLQPPGPVPPLRVAYHSACSLQHGQGVDREPQALLAAAGFAVVEVPEGHLCCGSAGTYNLLQPELAGALRERKLANIALTRPTSSPPAISAASPSYRATRRCRSCIPPMLLDWATGGPMPRELPPELTGLGADAAAPPSGPAATEEARQAR